MARFSTSLVITEIAPNCGLKEITLSTPAPVTSGSTITVDLPSYGISKTGILSVEGTSTSTVYGIMVTDAPTTAVSAGVLTVTSGTQTGTKTFRITGKGN